MRVETLLNECSKKLGVAPALGMQSKHQAGRKRRKSDGGAVFVTECEVEKSDQP